jgi:hypothetical protein
MDVKVFGCLFKDKNKMKLLVASLKTLINSKDCSESRLLSFLFRLSFSVIGRISPVNMSQPWLSEQVLGSQAAFGIVFRVSSNKLFEKISERVFRIRKRYHRSKKKLHF